MKIRVILLKYRAGMVVQKGMDFSMVPWDHQSDSDKDSHINQELIQVPVEDKQLYGLGGAVVKHLVGNIPTAKVTHLCTDRYFTGREILDYLVSRNVYLIGTVMTNRTDGVTGSFPKDTDMERGSPVSRYMRMEKLVLLNGNTRNLYLFCQVHLI
ncbi:piggyBac transposable element-derived protein 3 [Trichonephila inaurata madagascariensis]|uniref:PiggyBac transposable element-derived protein 3 n=1 Tax=Trichonephila inaurata madagascariensis TaxID=2747483 RepID=A0A8X6XG86_9ARAC|nr:piggyBac transposable element-derived protein 3 [Trichonephila inaurata madagascariensis]